MKENLHPIDDFFKKGLDDHQESPPPGNWDAINSKLDKQKVFSISKKYNELRKIAVAIFFLGFIAIVYALYLHKKDNDLVQTQIKNNIPISTTDNSNDISISKINTRKTDVEKEPQPNQNTKSASENTLPIDADNKKPQTDNNDKRNYMPPNAFHSNRSYTGLKATDEKRLGISLRPGKNVEPSNKNLKGSRAFVKSENNPSVAANKIAGKSKNAGSIAAEGAKATISESKHHGARPIPPSGFSISQLGKLKPVAESTVILIPGQTPAASANPNSILPVDRHNIVNASDNILKTAHQLSKPHGISLTAFYSGDKVDNNLKNDDHSARRGNRDEYKNNEQSTGSFSTGVLIDFKISPKFSIGSGLTYSSSATRIVPKTIYARLDNRGNVRYEFNCSAGYSYLNSKTAATPAPGDSATAVASTTHLQYIGLPVNIKYHINAGKFSINPVAGFTYNYLINANVGTTVMSGPIKQAYTKNTINGVKSNYLDGFISIEAAYKLSSRLSLVVAPGERLAITSINKDTPVNTYPSVFGISGGLRINF